MAVFSTQDILAKPIENYVWDPNTMAWVKETQPGGSGGGGGPITDGVDPTIKATVFDYANSNPLAVVLRDTNGDYVSVGGGTQYTEDAAAPANPVGTVPMLVRQDTPVGLVTTDGDNVAQRGTNYGAGYVTLLDTAGNPVSVGGGTQYAEDTASTAGELVTMAGVVRNDTRGSLVNANGDRTELQTNSSGDLRVDGSAVTQPISAASLPLPTGAATSDNQTNGTQKTLITDGVDTLAIDPSGAIAVTLTGNTQVVGTQANNDGPPGSINLGVLPAIANAAAPTYGEGSQVLLSTNLAGAQRITAASLPLPTGASTSALQTQPGVDIGDVTVNNAAGAAAVNIQDGGNSITVDGSVTATQATGTNLHTVLDSGTLSTITNVVHVDDNGGSLTVDGTIIAASPTVTTVGPTTLRNGSDTISIATNGKTTVVFTIISSAATTGQTLFQASADGGTTWIGQSAVSSQINQVPTLVSLWSGSAPFGVISFVLNVAGMTNARVIVQIPLDGDTSWYATATEATNVPIVTIGSGNVTSGSLTIASAITQTNRAQKTQITDGTRDGTVKAASTFPLLTDTALVVTQRDPLPAGTNTLGAVTGTKTNNNAAPGATNLGTLPAMATAAAPAYTEGFQTALSTDLYGNLRSLDTGTVIDFPPYYADSAVKPLTLSPDGRLKVINNQQDEVMDQMLYEMKVQTQAFLQIIEILATNNQMITRDDLVDSLEEEQG